MTVRRVILSGCLICLLILAGYQSVPTEAAAPQPMGNKGTTSATGPTIDVRFIDGSTLKVQLLEEKLELVTKHGTLQIAAMDVTRIEFATRIGREESEKIQSAIRSLGSAEHQRRRQAAADLRALGAKAYPAVQKATESEDPEVAQTTRDLLQLFETKYSESELAVREQDVVYTADSKIAGTLSAPVWRIRTFQFGELRMKIADLQSLGERVESDEDQAGNAEAGPVNLTAYANQFGQTYRFKVTGTQTGGNVWGTDQYTLDSTLAMAAVHAGVLKAGQTKVVRVRIVQSPPLFTATLRNNISSFGFGLYPSGAYEFVKK